MIFGRFIRLHCRGCLCLMEVIQFIAHGLFILFLSGGRGSFVLWGDGGRGGGASRFWGAGPGGGRAGCFLGPIGRVAVGGGAGVLVLVAAWV